MAMKTVAINCVFTVFLSFSFSAISGKTNVFPQYDGLITSHV